MNIVIIKGNLTRDPELRYTPKGTAVAKLGVAYNETWKNENGDKMERTHFFDVTAWSGRAEFVAQYFRKGKPILIQGKLVMESWDDKQTGQKKSKLSIVADNIEFCGGDRTDGAAPARGQQAAEAPQDDAPEYQDADTPF